MIDSKDFLSSSVIDSKEYLSQIVIYSKYAKYLPSSKRRENWEELVLRNASMHAAKYPEIADEIYEVYGRSVLSKQVVPSMRSFQFAGKAIEVNNSRMFNCASRKLDSATAFAEVMFLLLGGSGVGISVQKHHVEKIPALQTPPTRSKKYVVSDDIQGWADAIKHLIKSYTGGKTSYRFDYSEVRPKGTRLVTAGGKAPGPEPLKECIGKISKLLDRALEDRGEDTKLKPIEAHDVACHIANAVLAGGIRRSAMISLFSHNDDEMLLSKGNFPIEIIDVENIVNDSGHSEFQTTFVYKGRTESLMLSEWELNQIRETSTIPWYKLEEQRGRANNSVMLLRSATSEKYFRNMMKKVENSKAGEPGVYWTNDLELGTNPCCVTGDTEVEVQFDMYEYPNGVDYVGHKKMRIDQIEDYVKNNLGLSSISGVSVKSFNTEKGIAEFKTIKDVKMTRKDAELMKITDEETGKSITCTPDHRIWTKNRGYVEAQNLKENDILEIS
jgi:ribonucleoside-triphosphate reductase (thioredoxin)